MGTNALKNKDLLHGGKLSSYGRKARRVMRRELMKVSNGQQVTEKMVDDALRIFNEGVA
tara:strand:+ start:219 stop:395 length:177 start_codon:yes stop_codon:yes gene_type:complete